MIPPKQTLISSPRVDVSLLSNRRRREKQREMWIIELRLFVPPVAMQILMEHVRFLFFSSNSYTRFIHLRSLTIHQSSLPVPPVVSETHHITQVLPSSQTLSLSLSVKFSIFLPHLVPPLRSPCPPRGVSLLQRLRGPRPAALSPSVFTAPGALRTRGSSRLTLG